MVDSSDKAVSTAGLAAGEASLQSGAGMAAVRTEIRNFTHRLDRGFSSDRLPNWGQAGILRDPELAGSPACPGCPDPLFCHDLDTTPRPDDGLVAVTGASGYIGGRLVPELLARGYCVRAMVRADAMRFAERWPRAEIVAADAMCPGTLGPALQGVHTLYYLIHSMVMGQARFAAADLEAAVNIRQAAEKAGVQRIIYLGGVGCAETAPSEHLRSRQAVACALQQGRVPVTILRASIIIGSGSASFEILKHLVQNLPIILFPRWSNRLCQPIGIRDVVKYLVGVLEKPETAGRSFDIGGRDILTYEQMVRNLADLLRVRRSFIRSPLSALRLHSYFLSLITPVPGPIVFCLMDGLKSDTVCENDHIRQHLEFCPLGYREALLLAFSREEQDNVATRWSDAYPPAHELALKLYEVTPRPRYRAVYSLPTQQSPADLFQSFCQVGGQEGWFHNNWMWRLRGMIDRVFFGVGTARGRRARRSLQINDVIDFWRVEDLRPGRRLLLRSEMKLPGRAWLEFLVRRVGKERRVVIVAYFDTRSLFGRLYWLVLLPFHGVIFENLLRQIENRCGPLPRKASSAT